MLKKRYARSAIRGQAMKAIYKTGKTFVILTLREALEPSRFEANCSEKPQRVPAGEARPIRCLREIATTENLELREVRPVPQRISLVSTR